MMKIPLLVSLIFLFSCDVENKFDNTLDTFVGKDYNAILEYWGHPTEITELPNGNDELYYVRIKDLTSPFPDYWDEDGNIVPASCQVWFEVNKDLIIIKYRYKGIYCWED